MVWKIIKNKNNKKTEGNISLEKPSKEEKLDTVLFPCVYYLVSILSSILYNNDDICLELVPQMFRFFH